MPGHMDSTISLDKFREECGLMGVWNHKEAANIAYLGLYAQQHRGQEGAGVVAFDDSPVDGEPNEQFYVHKGLGLVSDVFSHFDFSRLPGRNAVGHVRYTTAGGNRLSNVQPLDAEISIGTVAIAHNGNLINADELRAELIQKGAIFGTTSDTEVIIHLMARAPRQTKVIEALIGALTQVRGAYSLVVLFRDRLYAIRDPNGFRPLAIAELDGSLIVASETCAFDLFGAKYIREVEPGEIVEITGQNTMTSYFPFGVSKPAPCVFEYVYFARPDSQIYGRNVYTVRKNMGRELAKEHPVQADFVIPVPDSGVTAAMGYSQESGIPLELGLIRNHYVGRTFIEPKQSIRDFGVKIKLNANGGLLQDKSIVVVDDSIVRGTTSKKLVSMLRAAGAKEIHMRISSPPTIDPCYYGIDTPEKSELIGANMSIPEIRQFLGVDSLGYLSIEGLYNAVEHANPGQGRGKFCDACFSGRYPVGTPVQFRKRQGELFQIG